MRTTLTIDDQLVRALKEAAHKSNKSFKEVVNETLRAGLAAKTIPSKTRSYRLKTFNMGQVAGDFNLDKALQLADALEDEELVRKLRMKK
jgi:3-methyladenine DNA glycosylase Tag